MPVYKTCPMCGANLDPGEACDCTKKEDRPAGTGTVQKQSPYDQDTTDPGKSQAANPLTALRVNNGLKAKEVVTVVRDVYPKFDKPLLSKCEHPDQYGVELLPPGMEALRVAFGLPDEPGKPWKADSHRRTCRISARLTEPDYEALQRKLRAGNLTAQEWIEGHVHQYLKKEAVQT